VCSRFARDTGTGHLISAWCAACDGSDWHFGDLGGIITGRPDPSVYGTQLKVLAVGQDFKTVFQKWFDNSFGWHDWQVIPGPADEPVGYTQGGKFQMLAQATDTGDIVHAGCTTCDGSDWGFDDLGRP